MYYIYILYLNNGDLYKGVTDDLKRRYKEHQVGKVRSTTNKNPKLILYEAYLNKEDALRREKFLKTTEGRRLLKQQIKSILNRCAHSSMDRTPAF